MLNLGFLIDLLLLGELFIFYKQLGVFFNVVVVFDDIYLWVRKGGLLGYVLGRF